MKYLKNKVVFLGLSLLTVSLVGLIFISAEEPYYQDDELLSLSELSKSDIDQMAAVIVEMQSARESKK